MDMRVKFRLPFSEYLDKLAGRNQTKEGAEIPDPTPMEPPINYVKQPSLASQIRDMVRSEALRQAAEAQGYETFEEADDFEIEDEPDLAATPYEAEFEGISAVQARARAAQETEERPVAARATPAPAEQASPQPAPAPAPPQPSGE